MTTQQASLIVDRSIVTSIQAMGLPALVVHTDWIDDWKVNKFTTYLGELFLAFSLSRDVRQELLLNALLNYHQRK